MKVWHLLKTTYKVSDFIGWQRDGSLELNPNFQRRSVWKTGAKSYLMDTIIRGFPIPIIFLRDKQSSLKTFTPLRDVVDGQQRLRTVIAFVAPNLLSNYDSQRDSFTISKNHNESFQGLTFQELPETAQRQILDYQFTVNVLPSDTDDREVKQVFARMNSSGYKLNAQELRNAEFFGAFKGRAEELATEQLNRWRDWHILNSDELARMNEVELSSDLIILILNGVSEKNDKTITSYYKKYDQEFSQGPEVARRFRGIFDTLQASFDDVMTLYFFKRTIFYALFAAVYDLQYGLGSDLAIKKVQPKILTSDQIESIKKAGGRISDRSAPEAIMNATTRRTTHVKERKMLLSYLTK